jgi:hypothetical protein
VILTEVLQRKGYLDAGIVSPLNVRMEIFDKIFANADLNHQLLSETDEILGNFFIDSKVEEAVGLDVQGFLKSHDAITKHENILIKRVDLLFTARSRRLIEHLEHVLGS